MNEWNVQLIKLRYDRYFIHYYNKLHILNFVTNNFACVEPISATVHGHAVITCGCWVLFVVSNCNRIPQEWKMHHSSGMNVFKIGRCDKLNKKINVYYIFYLNIYFHEFSVNLYVLLMCCINWLCSLFLSNTFFYLRMSVERRWFFRRQRKERRRIYRGNDYKGTQAKRVPEFHMKYRIWWGALFTMILSPSAMISHFLACHDCHVVGLIDNKRYNFHFRFLFQRQRHTKTKTIRWCKMQGEMNSNNNNSIILRMKLARTSMIIFFVFFCSFLFSVVGVIYRKVQHLLILCTCTPILFKLIFIFFSKYKYISIFDNKNGKKSCKYSYLLFQVKRQQNRYSDVNEKYL